MTWALLRRPMAYAQVTVTRIGPQAIRLELGITRVGNGKALCLLPWLGGGHGPDGATRGGCRAPHGGLASGLRFRLGSSLGHVSLLPLRHCMQYRHVAQYGSSAGRRIDLRQRTGILSRQL